MKGIKGLGERLAGLEQLHLEAKRLVQEQDDIAQSFVHNQQRASGLRDASILPDLCASHKQQLVVMSQVRNCNVISCHRPSFLGHIAVVDSFSVIRVSQTLLNYF